MSNRVLAIDDDKFIHQIINTSLGEFCDVLHAENGEQGIRTALETQPDIILLDVEMPGMNGFEVCSKLKSTQGTKDIPVMFLSGRGSIEERIQGYNSGAADYITKPFEIAELVARIKVLDAYRAESLSLKKDVEQAQSTAEIALTDIGDMGRVMRYVSQTYGTASLESLSDYFFQFFQPLSLSVVVAFWYLDEAFYFANNGAVCPLEQELLLNCKEGERFIDFGARTIINYPNVSLLVKNMPLADAPLYGRYKDLFPHVLEATNAKLNALAINERITNQAEELTETFKLVDETLGSQIISLYHHSKMSVNLIEQLYQTFCSTIPSLGLEPDQEEYILDALESTVTELRGHLDMGTDIQTSFNEVMTHMQHIMVERKKLIKCLNEDRVEAQVNEVTTQQDIELF